MIKSCILATNNPNLKLYILQSGTHTYMFRIIFTVAFLFLFQVANAAQIKKFELDKPEEIANITFSDAAGVTHNLTDYKGKVVLLNFWATWCEPCIHEMPALEKLTSFMAAKDVEVLPISIDSKGASVVKKFYDEQKITGLPILIDDKGQAFHQYKLQALPTTFVIDRHGQLIAKIMGEIDWNSQDTKDYLLSIGR